MPLEIKLRNDLSNFSLRATLEGVTYTFELEWDPRADDGQGQWFLNILDEQGVTMLLAGLAVVADYPVNIWHATPIPPGMLVFYDTSNQHQPPRLTDLGQRVRLWYFLAGELG